MLRMRHLLILLSVLSIFSTFPTSAQCDSSYYDRYYSARKFFPMKRNRDLTLQFTVVLDAAIDKLASYEQLALVGDHSKLGAWSANNAILLNRTEQLQQWQGIVVLPQNISIKYRYFIAAVHNETQGMQIRLWESSVQPRVMRISALAENRTDYFGLIEGQTARQVQKGWLNAGKIVQLKLFGNPLNLKEPLPEGQQMRMKLQPIEPERLNTILPSATANTQYVHMSYGNSYLREQPHHGVPYAENDILIFQTTLAQMQSVAYLLKLYSCQLNSDLVRLVAYQYIFADSMPNSEGNFTVHLISPLWFNSIGTINLQYLIVSPLATWENANATVSFQSSFVDYWRQEWQGLEVGRRGLGKSLKQNNNPAPFTENTMASFKAAAELGAEMIEFDVMLTRDLVPIVCQQYEIYVCLDAKTPKNKADLTPVPIKDVTYEQLKNLKTYQLQQGKVIEHVAYNNMLIEDNRLFPSLAEVLQQINHTLGFDIEIKWPQLLANAEYESEQTIDKNLYVDRILEVMYEHGCGRLSFFSSFDADIATLLRYKQNMYPVYLLIDNKEGRFADPRTNGIYDAINTAQAFDLMGIIVGASFVSRNPDWVQVAAKQNKLMFLWGDELKDATTIAWFKQQGVTGVIFDRMDLWRPANKSSMLAADEHLQELLQLQCAAGYEDEGANVNMTVYNILSNVNFL